MYFDLNANLYILHISNIFFRVTRYAF